jgi:protein SCO1
MAKRIALALVLGLLLAALLSGRVGRAEEERPAKLKLPDVELVDQDGVPRRLVPDLIAGRIALVSFVFTGCTTICSPVGANMAALDHLLGSRTGHEVSLFSVTLDPFNDTPAELAKWRAQFDDAPGWRLLTGDPRKVEALLHAMQADPADINGHDAFLWLGDPRTGTWRRVSSLADPAALVALVDRLAVRS